MRRVYVRLLARHLAAEARGPTRRWMAFERLVSASVVLLRIATGVRFPARGLDEWWWRARWRLEWLLGWNEWGTVRRVLQHARPGGVIVDVGAHIGYYSRIAATAVGPAGTVVALEPHPENLEVLRHNVRWHRNVVVVPCAAGSDPGTRRLYESPGSSNHSFSPGYTDARSSLDVGVSPLDDLLAALGLPAPDLVKIDVEGAEIEVLRGLRGTIARQAPVLVVEHAPTALAAAGHRSEQLLRLLWRHGYDVWDIDDSGRLAPVAPQPPEWVNLLCVPRQRSGSTHVKVDQHELERLLTEAILALRSSPHYGHPLAVVQAGAFDGITNDPLHRHLVRGGWRGVLLEPVPSIAQRLRATYAAHPDLEVVEAAIDHEVGSATLYRPRDELLGAPPWAPQIGSLHRDVVLWHRRAIPDIEGQVEAIPVRTTTVGAVLDEHELGDLALLHSDTEGHDAVVVRQVDLERHRPVILYEHKHLGDHVRQELAAHLLERGYLLASGPDDTLARPAELGATAGAPC